MKHKDLAKQAGFHIASSNLADIGWVWCSDGYPIDEQLERFAELIRADERQACFDLVYNHEDTYHHFGLCKRAAELIKQRGEE